MLIILAILMFAVAVVFSILGQGGGVLYTPIQVWAGVDFHIAATTSLFLIMIMSLSASIVFRKAKKIDWPLVLVLETSTTLGSFLGGMSSSHFSGRSLSVLFAVLIALAAYFMIRTFDVDRSCEKQQRGFLLWQRRLAEQTYCVNLAIGLPVSFVAGLSSGMVGVGGGILKVPMMVLLFGIPMDIAVGSSALMVGITSIGGFAGHVTSGHWDWRVSLVLAVAVFIGGQIGSRISLGLDKKKLKKSFGWFLLVIAALMIIRLWVAP
jgi:uncharacterized membrane protein YfcA